MSRKIQDGRAVAFKNESMLAALNPMAILQRGYSITRTLPGQSIVRNARQIKIDQPLEILLGRGTLTCHSERKRLGRDGLKNRSKKAETNALKIDTRINKFPWHPNLNRASKNRSKIWKKSSRHLNPVTCPWKKR
jgi:hypothetical protein